MGVDRGGQFLAPCHIVNSEQSDFLLDCGGRTISGQIHRRWGSQVQAELDRQTGGAVLPPSNRGRPSSNVAKRSGVVVCSIVPTSVRTM